MKETTEGFLLMFRKESDGYKFDSLGGFKDGFITAGRLTGKSLYEFDEFICKDLFSHGADAFKVSSVFKEKDSHYAYSKFPDKMIQFIFSLSKDSDYRVKIMNELAQKIEIIKTSNDSFTVFNTDRLKEKSQNRYINRSKSDSFEEKIMPKENKIQSQPELKNTINIDLNQVIGEIKEKIVGQDEAVESIVSNIYANQRIIETRNKDLIATQKASILLDGPTGTGKTAILKEVADKLSLPIVITSSTTYSSVGYVGSSLTDILVKLMEKANGDLELAQKGIVCVDEIDKFGGYSRNDELVMKRAVQQDLLTFISGGKFNIQFSGKSYEFDTSNLTFIGTGAFTSLRDKKIEENSSKKTTIGFINTNEEELKQEKQYTITPQDYIDYGLERELIGRFALLTSTRAYSVEDYKNILLKSTISPLKTFIEFAKSFGIEEVIYADEFIQEASEMAYRANFGARGLHQIISNLKNLLLIDIINSNSKSITLTVEMLKKSEEKNKRTY